MVVIEFKSKNALGRYVGVFENNEVYRFAKNTLHEFLTSSFTTIDDFPLIGGICAQYFALSTTLGEEHLENLTPHYVSKDSPIGRILKYEELKGVYVPESKSIYVLLEGSKEDVMITTFHEQMHYLQHFLGKFEWYGTYPTKSLDVLIEVEADYNALCLLNNLVPQSDHKLFSYLAELQRAYYDITHISKY